MKYNTTIQVLGKSPRTLNSLFNAIPVKRAAKLIGLDAAKYACKVSDIGNKRYIYFVPMVRGAWCVVCTRY